MVDYSKLPFFVQDGKPAFIIVVGEDSPSEDIVYASLVAKKVASFSGESMELEIVDIVKLDEEIKEEDKKQYNLILIGKSSTNTLIQDILQSGKKPYYEAREKEPDGESHYMFFVDPWGYGKHVLIITSFLTGEAVPPR